MTSEQKHSFVASSPFGTHHSRLRCPFLSSSKTYVSGTHNLTTSTGPQSTLAVQDDKVGMPLLQKSILGATEAVISEMVKLVTYHWQ
ncbi:MAG: hypothetical protein LBJ75_02510 [Puniceicoccales bacterium]|nr:hypothetical protein [Puniceicoccales bacterium]